MAPALGRYAAQPLVMCIQASQLSSKLLHVFEHQGCTLGPHLEPYLGRAPWGPTWGHTLGLPWGLALGACYGDLPLGAYLVGLWGSGT